MNLRELAHHLSLSQTTVSRALNGYPEVSEKTRLKVRDAAREFGYRPNATAARLAAGTTQSIGFAMPSDADGFDPHYTTFLRGVSRACAAAGYDMLLAPSLDQAGEEEALARLTGGGHVDGIVLPGPRDEDERVAQLLASGTPFVVHGRARGVGEHDWLDMDNAAAARLAVQHLRELGHRRIALLNSDGPFAFARARADGFLDAAGDEGRVVPCPMSHEGGMDGAAAALDAGATAVVTASILQARGVLHLLRKHRLVVARDVSLVTHDDGLRFMGPDTMSVPLTTTSSDLDLAGRTVGEMLLARIADRTAAWRNRVLRPELIARDSTGPVR